MSTTLKHYDVKTFVSSRSVGYLLKMAQSLMMEVASTAFIGHDLSFMQWLVLLKVHEGVARMPSDIGRQIHHDNGALTRMLDQLEARGFIERHRSSTDRRIVELQLTAAGASKVEELKPMAVDKLNTPLAEFSRLEFAELVRLLHKLIDGLRTCAQASTELGKSVTGKASGAAAGGAQSTRSGVTKTATARRGRAIARAESRQAKAPRAAPGKAAAGAARSKRARRAT